MKRTRKRPPPRFPAYMLAKIPCPKRRKEVERSYERIANRALYRMLEEKAKNACKDQIE